MRGANTFKVDFCLLLMNKVSWGVIFLLLVAIPFASAAPFESQLNNFIEQHLRPIASFLLGDVGGTGSFTSGEILFVKVLVFFLLLSLITIAVRNVPHLGDKKLSLFIAIIISILAVRYLTDAGLVSFIWLPYGALGIAFASLLPFIIFFFFLQGFDNSALRKLGWAFFLVIFAFLAYFRWDELALQTAAFNAAWIYLGIAIASLLLFFFDKDIHAFFVYNSISRITDRAKRVRAVEITSEIEHLQSLLASARDESSRREVQRSLDEAKRRLKDLLKS